MIVSTQNSLKYYLKHNWLNHIIVCHKKKKKTHKSETCVCLNNNDNNTLVIIKTETKPKTTATIATRDPFSC